MLSKFALYFDEVARSGSIRQASERLRIASSAVSRQILKIEEQLGVKLFDRTSQGLKLTAAGEIVLTFVRRWRREAVTLRSGIDDLVEMRCGEISIGVVEGSLGFLSRHLCKFSGRFPGITYNIRVSGSPGVVDLLLKGEVDIGIASPGTSSAVRIEHTLLHPIGALAPPSHPVADLPELSVADCNSYPLIIPGDSLSLRALIDEIWRTDTGEEPRAHAVGSTVGAIKELVIAGVGVGILSKNDAQEEIDAGLLAFVPLAGSAVRPANTSLITMNARALSPPASRLLEHFSLSMAEEIE